MNITFNKDTYLVMDRSQINFKGVELVLLSEKFITVKKNQETTWDELKPVVISHINDYFQNNKKPILNTRKISKVGKIFTKKSLKQ